MSDAPISPVAPSWTGTIVTVPVVLVFNSFCILLVSPAAIRKASHSGFGRHNCDECSPSLHCGALLDMHDCDGPRRAGLPLVLHPLGIACGDTKASHSGFGRHDCDERSPSLHCGA